MLDATVGATGLRRPEAQKLLGQFLFSGWEAHEKPVSALSGGERRRLALALVVASGANFLVLDEPTNHLDLESRESLEDALAAFPGTVLLVTHDRALLDAVSARVIAIEDHANRVLPGRLGGSTRATPAREASARARAEGAEAEAREAVRRRRDPKARRRSSSSSVRSRGPRSGSPSSSGSSPRTGRTSTWSARIERHGRTSRHCSSAGSRCSRALSASALERRHRQAVAVKLRVVELGSLADGPTTPSPGPRCGSCSQAAIPRS